MIVWLLLCLLLDQFIGTLGSVRDASQLELAVRGELERGLTCDCGFELCSLFADLSLF